MVMELLIISLDPHMISSFIANEIWYAQVFHICDFDYPTCVLRKDIST